MASTYFEVKDIKLAKAKCGKEPWFKLDVSKTRKNKNAQQPTYYIPFTAKTSGGKRFPLALRFNKQIIASNAKIPFGVKDEDARDVRVSFRQLTQDELDITDYEESKRTSLIQSNTEFVEALGIIADEYLELVKREVLTYRGDKFKLKVKTINCFRQTHREAGDGEEGDEEGDEESNEKSKIKLPHPIFRIKIPADPLTKKLGFNSEKTGHIYVVFDMAKASKDAKTSDGKTSDVKKKPIVAKIKTFKGYVDLNVTNAKHFITYMSLTGGMIMFDSICISKSGISLLCQFKEIHVWRHKPLKIEAMNDEMANEMAEYGVSNKDEEEVFDEPDDSNHENDIESKSAKSKVKSKTQSNIKDKIKATTKLVARKLVKALDNNNSDNEVSADEDEPNANEEEPNADDDADADDDANADAEEEPNADADADAEEEPNADADADADAEEEPNADADADAEDEPNANAAGKDDSEENKPKNNSKHKEPKPSDKPSNPSSLTVKPTKEKSSASAKSKNKTSEPSAKPKTGGDLKSGPRLK